MKIMAIGILLIVAVSIVALHNYVVLDKEEPTSEELPEAPEEKVFQGAVPLGYDLEHFRKTGITKKLSE